jgi:cytosine/adenosine deaminase-related metal-dependent hydrolase
MSLNRIVYGKFLVAGSGENRRIITDGAVYTEDGVIRDLGKYEEISKDYSCDETLGSKAFIVMPGLINSHHHGRGISPLRTGVKDAPLEVWRASLGKTYDVDVYHNTLLSCIKLIESGVTTTLHHFYGHDPAELSMFEEDVERALQAHIDSGMRVAFAPAVRDQNQLVYIGEEDFVSQLPERVAEKLLIEKPEETRILRRVNNYFIVFKTLYDKYQDFEGRVKLQLGPAGVQWCSDELLQRIRDEAERYGVGIHMHLQESRYQRDYGFRLFDKSPLEHLADLDFLGSDISFAHSVWMTEKDIGILAGTGAVVVHNPSSNLRLFNGVAPIVSMIDMGVEVALGIDDTGINDDEDIFQEMRLCSLIHRSPGVMNYERYLKNLCPSKILDMATTGGARASGFGDKIGEIKKDAYADLVLVDMKEIPFDVIPRMSVEDLLVGWVKGRDVDTVIINGEIVMKGNKVVKLDKSKVVGTLKESIKNLEAPTPEMEEYKDYIARYYEIWE